MTALILLLGIGIISALLLYFSFKLEEKHFLLQLLSIIVAFVLLAYVPGVMIGSQEVCENVVANQTINGSNTMFEYKKQCYQNDSSIPVGFLWTYYSFLFLFFAYISVKLVKDVMDALNKQIGK